MNKEFSVGDHVYLRVREKKSSLNLGSCAKLSPRYCGLFEVIERIGRVAYRLVFPASTRAHNYFHVSLLKRYVHDPNHVINWDVFQVEPEGEFRISNVHPRQKGHNALEPGHRASKGAMGALWT